MNTKTISTKAASESDSTRAVRDMARGSTNPNAVLEALTRQRATFTAAELNRALGKQIGDEPGRTRIANAVLTHADVVRLADRPGGAATRYTTRTVLESEQQVLRAAAQLSQDEGHAVGNQVRAHVMASQRFSRARADQRRAFERATGAAGLCVIDGQAGTGKSYTMAAVRDVYEQSGRTVIGIAPTNAVAQDMSRDGFRHAGTVHSELFALNNGRRQWDNRTVVIVDEAAMLDTTLMAELTRHASTAGAKLVLVGDDRQLGSIDRGGMFGALKDRHGAAVLTSITRQHKDEDRRASALMAEGKFAEALAIYQEKGGITWRRTQDEARAALVAQWAKDSAAAPDKSRFVFAYTNADVALLNADLRAVRRRLGQLGADHELPSADGRRAFATGDRILFTATDKKKGLYNGVAGTVSGIDGTRITVRLDGRRGETREFDAEDFRGFRHGYAGTIYKGQGRTIDQTYLYHSKHWRAAASYVALTRHRDKAELFVATDTARDVAALARQMARVDERRAASQFHVAGRYAPERPIETWETARRGEAAEQVRPRSAGGGEVRVARDQAIESDRVVRDLTDGDQGLDEVVHIAEDVPELGSKAATENLRNSFRAAVKPLTRRDEDEPRPKTRRRSGETEGEFLRLARHVARRFDARRDFRQRAAITTRSITIPAEAFAVAPPYLFNAFDLHNQWDDAADFDESHDIWQHAHSPDL